MDYTYNSIVKPADVITYLTIGDDQIDLVESLCDRASKVIETLCNRQFMNYDGTSVVEITEIKSGNGGPYLFTNVYPIISIREINDDIDRDWGIDSTCDIDTYTFDAESGVIISDTFFMKGNQNIKIIYTAGYSSTTIPKDLIQATLEIASLLYKNKDWIGLSSKSFSDGSVALSNFKLSEWGKSIIAYYSKPLGRGI